MQEHETLITGSGEHQVQGKVEFQNGECLLQMLDNN